MPVKYDIADKYYLYYDGGNEVPPVHINCAAAVTDTVTDTVTDSDFEKNIDYWMGEYDMTTKSYNTKKNYKFSYNAEKNYEFSYDTDLKEILDERKEEKEKERIEKAIKEYDKEVRKTPTLAIPEPGDSMRYPKVYIKRVKIDSPWTIIFWSDGKISKAKCSWDDLFDPEIGIMVAICNRIFRTRQNFRKILSNLIKNAEMPKEVDLWMKD